MKDSLKFTLLVIGIFLTFFVMGREIVETRSRLRKTQEQIAQEQKEKTWLQDELKDTRVELNKTERDLKTARDKLEFVNRKIIALRVNNSALNSAKQELEQKVAFLEQEKRIFEARLHSLSELKKAIRQVKQDIRKNKIARQKELDKWETAQGNRGFLTKDGEPFSKPKVNIEVRPANLSLNKK